MSVRNIYEKFINGDSLTDIEVNEGVKFFKKLSDDLYLLGPIFRLSAHEAARAYDRLKSYQDARKEN